MCMHVYLFYELNKIIFVFNNRKCIFLGRPAAGTATKRDQNLTNPPSSVHVVFLARLSLTLLHPLKFKNKKRDVAY